MLKIKTIQFIKAVYDESISHNVFSIANITFSNAAPIFGALLFWKKNDDHLPFTPENEYKFFYDMANIQYYASVKFPKGTNLTTDERQELAYILLEQRGAVGSYSFSTKKKTVFSPVKAFAQIGHDATKQLAWHTAAVQEHHSKLLPVLDAIDFSILCKENPYLTEQFLIEHLPRIDLQALQYNFPVLARLSKSFKAHIVLTLQSQGQLTQTDLIEDSEYFIESDDFYSEYAFNYLPEVEEFVDEVFEHFEYDRGPYQWPGSNHLIKGIPSLFAQQYDRHGDRHLTIEEMASKLAHYSAEQLKLFSGMCSLHWLTAFKQLWDWSYVCAWNPHLSEAFINAHAAYIDYPALGMNTKIKLSTAFIEKHLHKFNLHMPVPLIICHLTEQFYLSNKEQIIVDRSLLMKYSDAIDQYEYMLLEDLIDF